MTQLAEILTSPTVADALHLGPATITTPGTKQVSLCLEGGEEVAAQLALALPYLPAEGDVVLVLGKDGRYYVVGLLAATGRTSLAFRGDVKLEAIGGSIDLAADEGLRLSGRQVAVEAGELTMRAGAVVQRFKSVYQRIRGLVSLHAERSDTIVDEAATTRAKRASIVTEKTMTINGEQIHLG